MDFNTFLRVVNVSSHDSDKIKAFTIGHHDTTDVDEDSLLT